MMNITWNGLLKFFSDNSLNQQINQRLNVVNQLNKRTGKPQLDYADIPQDMRAKCSEEQLNELVDQTTLGTLNNKTKGVCIPDYMLKR